MDYCKETIPDLFRSDQELEDSYIETKEQIIELFHQLSPERQFWLIKELENYVDDDQ